MRASFNLRLEFTEKPRGHKIENFKEALPKSIDEIARYKMKSEGVKESDFLIVSKYMLGWIDKQQLTPFIKKNA